MSTAPAARPARATPAALGALALLLTSSSLAPLFSSGRWVLPAVGAVALVVVVGIALRALRIPMLLVVCGQLMALVGLLTGAFTDAGVLRVLPGPAAIDQLRALAHGVSEEISAEKVPVSVSQSMLLLVVAALCVAAIVVDLLVAGVQAPAVAGLVLLCVVAIPTSLSPQLLPWWSFALGGLGLALLLLSNGASRVARGVALAGSAGFVVAVGVALVAALGVGVAATGIGTQGRLPPQANNSTGVALNPFTQLRGELGARTATPLFTVSGMTQPTYLRTVTLDRFVNDQGWVVNKLAFGDSPDGAMAKQELRGQSQTVSVRGEQYDDRWLPSPGFPTEVRGPDAPLSGYTYNAEAGVLQTARRQALPAYTVDAVTPGASAAELRALGRTPQSQAGVDPRWLQLDDVDPRVGELAKSIAGQAPTTFDAAAALSTYFTDPANGFTYALSAGAGGIGNDALVDFLTVSKQGFCEQYASAMGVLLRELGIASRVVLGYTPGAGDATTRTVTTDDAHAWVEVYFSGIGWVTFDPTPLADGRGLAPDYLAQSAPPANAPPPVPAQAEPAPPVQAPAPTPAPPPAADQAAPQAPSNASAGRSAALLLDVVGAVMLLGLALCSPALIRRRRRNRRIADGSPDAAWKELTDLASDRGTDVANTETPRQAADRLCTEHRLDADARAAVGVVVGAAEEQWYGAATASGSSRTQATNIEDLVTAWQRCAPLKRAQRAFPRSVLLWVHQPDSFTNRVASPTG